MIRKEGLYRYSGIFLVLLIAALFLGKSLLEANLEEERTRPSLRKVVSYLGEENPEEATMVGVAVALGWEEVATDFLFLQSIQYFGDWKLKKEVKFKKLYPLLQAMSAISPHFVPGYSFGALVLEELGYVDEAIDFLSQGIKNNPSAFELWLYRDFTIRLFKTKEYKKAIEGIKLALQLRGYPPILERILAYAYEKDGQIEEAILQWQRIYSSTQDPVVKEICQRHIERLTQVKNQR